MDWLRLAHDIGVYAIFTLVGLFAVGWLYLMIVVCTLVLRGLTRKGRKNAKEIYGSGALRAIQSTDLAGNLCWVAALKVRRWLFIDVVLLMAVGILLGFLEAALR